MKYATKYVLVPVAEYSNGRAKYTLPTVKDDITAEYSSLVNNLKRAGTNDGIVEKDGLHAYRLRKILEQTKRRRGNLSTRPPPTRLETELISMLKKEKRNENDDEREEEEEEAEGNVSPAIDFTRESEEEEEEKEEAEEEKEEEETKLTIKKRARSVDSTRQRVRSPIRAAVVSKKIKSSPVRAATTKKTRKTKGTPLFPSPVSPVTTGVLTRGRIGRKLAKKPAWERWK